MTSGRVVDLPGFRALQHQLQIVHHKAVDEQTDEGDEEKNDGVRDERFDLFPPAAERDEQIERGADEEKDEQIDADNHDDSDVPEMRGGRGFLCETVEHDAVREERDQAKHQAADEDELLSRLDPVQTEYYCADQNTGQIEDELTTGQGNKFQFRIFVYVHHFGDFEGGPLGRLFFRCDHSDLEDCSITSRLC